MSKKEKKYIKDFFLLKHKHFYVLPTFVFYYNKEEFFESGVCTPAISISFKWLKFVIGYQLQKNAYYGSSEKNGI